MNNPEHLIKKIGAGTASWDDFSNFLNLKYNLKPFFKLANRIRTNNFGNQIKIYIPDKRFPAISITGSKCALQCEHCNEKYLDGMKHATTPRKLETLLLNLSKNEGVGALISGGCEDDGSVPLLGFLDVIKKVKNQTNLIINTHTGFLNEETAKKLADTKVDIVSLDVNIDEEILKEIYHLDKNIGDYKESIKLLKKYDLNIVPHICIGLYYGKLHKELDSIKFIKEIIVNPSLIVLIALIAPISPEEKRKKFSAPNPIDIAKVILVLRYLFPKTELSLGCMRPRGALKVEVEQHAMLAGINRIEIPSKRTLRWAKKQYPEMKFEFYSACCAIPERFEKYAESFKKDISRYSNI